MEESKKIANTAVTKTTWKYTRVVVDKDNINELFVHLASRRDLRNAQVNSVKKLLEQGSHWESPFVANKVGEIYRLIDGNHRKAALEQYLMKHPQRKVDVQICYYEDLSEEEEKQYYRRWNVGAKQSANDFIQLHWQDLEFPRWWNKNGKHICNVSHKPGRNTISLSVLLAPYFSRSNSNLAWVPNGEVLVDLVKAMTVTDFQRVRTFLEGYVAKFGKPEPNNKAVLMWQQLQFWTLSAVYWRNAHLVPEKELWARLFKTSHEPRFIVPPTGSRSGSRENVKYMYDIVIEVANRSVKSQDKRFLPYQQQHPPRVVKDDQPVFVVTRE